MTEADDGAEGAGPQAAYEEMQGFADPNLLYGDAPDKNQDANRNTTDSAKPPVPTKSAIKQ